MDTDKNTSSEETKVTRRDFLYLTTGSFTAVGVGAVAWPFIVQMNINSNKVRYLTISCLYNKIV